MAADGGKAKARDEADQEIERFYQGRAMAFRDVAKALKQVAQAAPAEAKKSCTECGGRPSGCPSCGSASLIDQGDGEVACEGCGYQGKGGAAGRPVGQAEGVEVTEHDDGFGLRWGPWSAWVPMDAARIIASSVNAETVGLPEGATDDDGRVRLEDGRTIYKDGEDIRLEGGGDASYTLDADETLAVCYLLQQPSARAPAPNVTSALEWLAEQHESDAKQVPMGAAFQGGPLHDAPIYGVHAWAARKARELAAAIRRGKARPPLGTSEAAEWSTRSILGAAADSQPAPTDTREPEVWEDDAALVARAAEACHHLHGRSLPRWSHLGATFGIGSGSATKLARRLGLDPDEVIGGIPEDAELDEDDERSDTREPAPTKGKRCVVCGEPSLGDRWCSIECHRRGDTSTPSSEPSDEAHDAWSRWDADREARGQSIPTYETWMAGWYARAAQDIYERRKAIEAEPAPKVVEGPPEDEPDIIDYTVDGLRLRWVSSIDGAVVHEVLVPGARPACQDFHLYVELRDALGCPRTMKHDDVIARARGATQEPDSGRLAEQLKSARAGLALMVVDRDHWKARHEALASRVWDGTHGHKAAELARREGLVEGYQMAIDHLADTRALSPQRLDMGRTALETNPNRPELDDTSRNGR